MLSRKFTPWTLGALMMLMISGLANAPLAAAGVPGSTSAINTDRQGLALGGFDPVAYFDQHRPMHGKKAISATYAGAHYLFSSEAHRRMFLGAPEKYVPQFGGFCAVGTSFGKKVDIDPKTGKVIDGKLYVNNNSKAQAVFDKDTQGTIARAEQNWPAVRDQPF